MKLSHTSYGSNVPVRDLYREGVDYHEEIFEVDSDGVLKFLEKLSDLRDSIYVYASDDCHLKFYLAGDRSLWVEIQCGDFWAISEVPTPAAARAIIEMASKREPFGEQIPTTHQEWGAYGSTGN